MLTLPTTLKPNPKADSLVILNFYVTIILAVFGIIATVHWLMKNEPFTRPVQGMGFITNFLTLKSSVKLSHAHNP